jgi:mRNA interferase RelE/StbE
VGSFELRVAPAARRAMIRLPESAAAAIGEFIVGPLLENPRRVGKPMLNELFGFHVARRGAYRVVYRIHDDEGYVRVERIDHRADIYRPR